MNYVYHYKRILLQLRRILIIIKKRYLLSYILIAANVENKVIDENH